MDEKTQKLFDAIELESMQGVENALLIGADIDGKNVLGETPLMMAISTGCYFIAEYLLKCGANVELKDKFLGETALIKAVRKDNIGIVVMLIDQYKANINKNDGSGNTPLNWAAVGAKEVVEALLARGADKEIKDKNGRTPLLTAAYDDCLENVEILVKSDVKMDVKDNSGMTVLDYIKNSKIDENGYFYQYLLNYKENKILESQIEVTSAQENSINF